MRHARVAISLSMTLSLVLVLTACGGARDEAAPQAEDEAAQETLAQEQQPVESPYRIASVRGQAPSGVAVVGDAWGCDASSSVDTLAKDLIAGRVDFAVVPSDMASQLYNATAGAVMAVDAVDAGDGLLCVTVVRTEHFASDPDQVVEFVARHGELASGASGVTFYRGSAMQSAVTEQLKDLYVQDASQVGGQLPPDNFYFLG